MEPTNGTVPTMTEISISYHPQVSLRLKPVLTGSTHAYELLLAHWNPDTIEFIEEFKVLYLNRANRVLGCCNISSGGLTATVADPRIILSIALKVLATAIILAHNHPSGNLRPSSNDELITQKIIAAARFLDIHVADHLIISRDGYLSFADEGFL